MSANARRLKALLYLIVLFPLWWLQRTHANPAAPLFAAALDGDHGGGGGHGDDDDCDDGDDGDHGDDHDDDDGDDDDDDDDDDGGGQVTDCNGNGIDDSIDIAQGTSLDHDQDGIPDECQPKIVGYCNGTGTRNFGVDCPCGNTMPTGSNTGCANRAGTGGSLTASGTPSVSNDDVTLYATGLPVGVPGYFFQGASPGSPVVFGNGIRCLAQFFRIRKIQHASGVDTYPVPGGLPISVEFHIQAGTTTYYQVLYRDSGGPCGGTVNSTNSLSITWGL